MRYLTLFSRLILRPMRKELLRTLLTALAVGLGVSVVLAIEMAGEAAAGSFQSSLETLSGDSDLEVTATGGVPAAVVAKLVTAPYDLHVRPRMEDYATVLPSRHTVAVIGIDVLADFGAARGVDGGSGSFDTVWVGPALRKRSGDRIRLIFNDRELEFTVGGVLPKEAEDAVVMDLAVATRAMARHDGALDRILIRTPRGDRDWQSIVGGLLPEGLTVAPVGSRTNENRRMLEAFRWNLRVLSYIALIVGAFLIYNTISVSVVRRRSEIGIVRALGATRTAVIAAFLAEGACFGLAGAIIGVLLGKFLAQSAVGMVAMTVQSLYVSSRPAAIELT